MKYSWVEINLHLGFSPSELETKTWARLLEKCLASVPFVCWTFHIFDYFFRTIVCTVAKLATTIPLWVLKKYCIILEWFQIQYCFRTTLCAITRLVRNVPLLVLKKWCYFLEWVEIHHGCLSLIELFIFKTTTYDVAILARMFPMCVLEKCYFPQKSKMAILYSDWHCNVFDLLSRLTT